MTSTARTSAPLLLAALAAAAMGIGVATAAPADAKPHTNTNTTTTTTTGDSTTPPPNLIRKGGGDPDLRGGVDNLSSGSDKPTEGRDPIPHACVNGKHVPACRH